MKKVFCKDCDYLTNEKKVIFPKFYASIKFRNDKSEIRVTSSSYLCKAKIQIEREVVVNPIKEEVKLHVIVDDPNKLNKNNDCCLFKKSTLFDIVKQDLKTFLDGLL
jgi:hypothetical protein